MDQLDSPIERNKRTPGRVAAGVLAHLSVLYASHWKPAKPKDEYMEILFPKMWEDESTNGDDLYRELKTSAKTDLQELARYFMLDATFICGAYCVQAMKAQKAGQSAAAWTYVADAQFWHGLIASSTVHWQDEKAKASELARLNAEKRHRENYAFRAYAVDWYKENRKAFKSMDAAAAELVKHLPVTFRTIRQWLTQYKKEQSASKP